jgi:pimeloyl-ACP methyl ester carboxylesterase
MMIKKLIIISSGPFEKSYAASIMETRLDRLADRDRGEARSILKRLMESNVENKDRLMERFGDLLSRADSYDPLNNDNDEIEISFDIFKSIWKEAEELRASGELLRIGKGIHCPVVAIHGDYDPHPYEGVKIPLSSILADFRFILIEKCGHIPWIERNVRDEFFDILKRELH